MHFFVVTTRQSSKMESSLYFINYNKQSTQHTLIIMSSTEYTNKYLDDIAMVLAASKLSSSEGEGYPATPTHSSSSSTLAASSSNSKPEQENTPPRGSSLAPFNDYNELGKTDTKTTRKWTLKQRVSLNDDDDEEDTTKPYPPSPPRIDASWSSFLFGALSASNPLPPQMRQGILQPKPIRCNTSMVTEDTSAMMSLSNSYCYSTPERKTTRSSSRIVCPPLRHKSRRHVEKLVL